LTDDPDARDLRFFRFSNGSSWSMLVRRQWGLPTAAEVAVSAQVS
jgi:hypothetical protein